MATITELHVDDLSGGFVSELHRILEHLADRGFHVVKAKVTHDAGTPEAQVEHLIGGPEEGAVAASEPGDAAPGAGAAAPADTATAPA
jgi:hypothetical protein